MLTMCKLTIFKTKKLLNNFLTVELFSALFYEQKKIVKLLTCSRVHFCLEVNLCLIFNFEIHSPVNRKTCSW